MEIFEALDLLVGLAQVCGCFLEFMGLSSGVGAGMAAVKVQKNRRERRAAQQAGTPPPPKTPWRWALLILLALTFFLVGLVFLKYTRDLPAAK
jgi:hypothetical protein